MEYTSFLLFNSYDGKDNLAQYNKLLSEGWVPVRETRGQSGEGYVKIWLCILQRPKQDDNPYKVNAL